MATPQDLEIEYYRSVEDFFATLRGVPHTLSPKDFHLLRQWWADRVPLSAIRTGITEAFAKRRDRGENEPVVSLSYCRHSVRAAAKRAAEMQVGAHDDGVADDTPDRAQQLNHLADLLGETAREIRHENPRLADLIAGISATVAAAVELPAATIEEHLFALESTMLINCFETLDESQRSQIDARARAVADSSTTTPQGRERAFKAHRDRYLREQLRLPRLELDG